MKSNSQFEFVPRDTEKFEFLDLVDFGGVAISVESVTRDFWDKVFAVQGGENA